MDDDDDAMNICEVAGEIRIRNKVHKNDSVGVA